MRVNQLYNNKKYFYTQLKETQLVFNKKAQFRKKKIL